MKLRGMEKLMLLDLPVTKDFKLEEFFHTNTGLDNWPDRMDMVKTISNIYLLTENVLQPARDRWGKLRISSGYRSDDVNKAVGGVNGSFHTFGKAADIVPMNGLLTDVFEWMVDNLDYRKIILEPHWIHVSFDTDDLQHRAFITEFQGDKIKYVELK